MVNTRTSKQACPRLILAVCGSALALNALAGCAKNEKKASLEGTQIPAAFAPVPPWDPGDRPVSEPVLMGVRASNQSARLISSRRLEANGATEAIEPSVIGGSVGEVHRVKLAVSEARVPEVIHALLGPDGLGQSYVIDPSIMKNAATQTVTMDIDEEMTTQDIRELLAGLGRMFGWSIQDVDGTVYIRGTKDGLAKNPAAPVIEAMAAIGDQSPVVRVRRMQYVSPTELTKLLEGMVSDGGTAVAVGRQIVILDTAANANRIARLLAALDVPSFDGVEIWTYRLANRTPEEAKTLLDAITAPSKLGGGAAGDPLVAYVAVPGTQRIMVVSRDATAQSYVHDLLDQIDQPPDSPVRNRYVYRIQYYDPAALLNLINSFFADRIESSGGIGAGAGTGSVGTPAVGGASKLAAGTGMRLTLDPAEDLLLIQSTTDDYADLLSTLHMIDRPRQQVELTSIIAEVRLSNSLEYGVEYFLQALDQKGLGILELAGGASDLLTGTPTASAFFTGADGFAIIKALERVSDVAILQQPHVTVMDGSDASLLVGGKTPTPNGQLNTDTGAVQTSTEYQDTGITLTITPKVNESGDVTLHIVQEINNVLGQTDLGPEFVTRKLETNVTVPHGNTLLLGGIIDNTQTRSARKIPILGDVPGVGAAFQSKVNEDERNELLLAITPRIINTPSEGQRTMSQFMMAARGLQRAMYENAESLPPSSLNPTVRQPQPVVRVDGPPAPEANPEERPGGLESLPPEFLKELERRSDADTPEAPAMEGALAGPVMAGPVVGPPVPATLTSW